MMKRRIKSIFAFVLALVIFVGMGTTTIAEDLRVGDDPQPPTGKISVENITEKNAIVTAYLIAEGKFENGKITGYEAVKEGSIVDLENPTKTEITNLAKQIETLVDDKTVTVIKTLTKEDNNAGTYSQEGVPLGMYLVLVRGTGATIYNPMIVSTYQKLDDQDDLTIHNGTVSVNDKFFKNGYAKSSKVDLKKTIENPGSKNEKGDDVAIGDRVTFKIETTMPSYSDEYENITFNITDELSGGLEFDKDSNITVEVGGNKIDEDATTYTISKSEVNKGFNIEFTSDFIKSNGLKSIVVTYDAILSEDAGINFDPNTNTATVTYTNNPNGDTTTKTDKTYHYTFGIDAMLGGTEEGKKTKTHEIFKVKENGKVESITEEETEIIRDVKVDKPLEGATFTLTNDATDKIYEATSDKDGYLEFTGLDAGTYTLKETEAPAGYSVDKTPHTVVISADYNNDGTLHKYTITIDGKTTSTYKATYSSESEVTQIEGQVETTVIQNTNLPELPQTGGIGTYIFTALGIVIMALAAAAYIRSKKRPQDRNQ